MRARVAWAHDWISDPSLAAVFQTLPGASFIVNGATPAKNSALASAGAEHRLANGVDAIRQVRRRVRLTTPQPMPVPARCATRGEVALVSRAQRSNADKFTQSAYT